MARMQGIVYGIWDRWKTIARHLGDFQARLVLTLFYFLVFGPVALVVRWSSDPLCIKAGTPRGWCPRANSRHSLLDQAGRQH
jgi:hypothetical protein